MNLLKLRRVLCCQLGTLPNSEEIQRKAAAEMIDIIDRALQAQKAADAQVGA